MLLDKLSPYYGIKSSLSKQSAGLIDEFNKNIIHQASNEKYIIDSLQRIFREIVDTNIDPSLINELVAIYYQKYKWLNQSSWNLTPATNKNLNEENTNPGFSKVDLTHNFSVASKDSIELMINHCKTLQPHEQRECIFNLSKDSPILQDINQTLNHKYKSSLMLFLKNKNIDRSFFVLGQFKYHSKYSSKDSSTWHLDGDPRFIKLLIYLTDDPSNDGAFNISHWSALYPDYKQCTFTDLSLMVTLDEKQRICNQFSQAPSFLNHLLISDLVFGPLTKGGIQFTRTQVSIKKYQGVIFQGSTCIHAGGGNVSHDRPVLQLMLSCT